MSDGNMTLQELANLLNLTLTEVRTGHPDYKRVFISFEGVQIGKIVIYKDEYQHVNWYSNSPTGPLNALDRIYFCWEQWEHSLQIWSEEEWVEVVKNATEQEAVDFAARLIWRKAHPQKGKKGIKHKNLRSFIPRRY